VQVDLEKIRRFSLVVALLLLTYSFAIEFVATEHISPLGLPFIVKHPEYIPIALILASFYSALRFLFYGYIVNASPRRRRIQLMEYFKEYKTSDRTHESKLELDGSIIRQLISDINVFLPRATYDLSLFKDRGRLFIRISKLQWLYTILVDIDYAAPIWVSAFALFHSIDPALFRSMLAM